MAGVHDARIDQPRFLQAGDDFDGCRARPGRFRETSACAVPGAAHWCRLAHAVRRMAGALPEPLQAAQSRSAAASSKRPLSPKPAPDDHFPQSIENDELAVREPRDDHVKTIGA